MQLIILDNGCTDDTKNVISNIPKDKFDSLVSLDVEFNSINNIPITHSYIKGDYVVEFTDDDRMLEFNLAMLLDKLESDSNIGVAYSLAQVIDAKSERQGLVKGLKMEGNQFEQILTTSTIAMPSAMIRREVWNNPVHLPLKCGGEWPRYIETAHRGWKLECIDGELVELRVHDGSDTQTSGFRDKKFIDMHLETWEHWIVDRGVEVSGEAKDAMLNVIANLVMFAGLNREETNKVMHRAFSIMRGERG
jgi:hypothetical protein